MKKSTIYKQYEIDFNEPIVSFEVAKCLDRRFSRYAKKFYVANDNVKLGENVYNKGDLISFDHLFRYYKIIPKSFIGAPSIDKTINYLKKRYNFTIEIVKNEDNTYSSFIMTKYSDIVERKDGFMDELSAQNWAIKESLI